MEIIAFNSKASFTIVNTKRDLALSRFVALNAKLRVLLTSVN